MTEILDLELINAMHKIFQDLIEYDIALSDQPFRGLDILLNDYAKKFDLLRKIDKKEIVHNKVENE